MRLKKVMSLLLAATMMLAVITAVSSCGFDFNSFLGEGESQTQDGAETVNNEVETANKNESGNDRVENNGGGVENDSSAGDKPEENKPTAPATYDFEFMRKSTYSPNVFVINALYSQRFTNG